MSEKNLLARIPRTATEEVQISISEYKGKKFLDMRIFYTTDGGNSWLPTKKGVAFYPETFEKLKEAVEIAERELGEGEA